MTEAERLRMLERTIAASEPFPISEFEQLSASSQIALESKVRGELEQLAGELGPEAIDPLISHLEGLIGELISGCAPVEMIADIRQTIERLKRRRAQHN